MTKSWSYLKQHSTIKHLKCIFGGKKQQQCIRLVIDELSRKKTGTVKAKAFKNPGFLKLNVPEWENYFSFFKEGGDDLKINDNSEPKVSLVE